MRFALSLIVALLCVSCGYQLGPVKPKRMQGVQRICVKNFKNFTLQPRMEARVASAVIRQMQLDGTYEITDEARADAILGGAVLTIEKAPARVVRGNVLQSSEYRLQITCQYTLASARTGAILEQRKVVGSTDFFVTAGSSGSDLLTADSGHDERQAIPLAVEDLAARISSLVSEGW